MDKLASIIEEMDAQGKHHWTKATKSHPYGGDPELTCLTLHSEKI